MANPHLHSAELRGGQERGAAPAWITLVLLLLCCDISFTNNCRKGEGKKTALSLY